VSEVAPSEVLVNSHILIVERKRCLVRFLCLLEILLFLIKKTYLDQGVDFLLLREGGRKHRVLEKLYSLVDAVSARKDSA
jgi:hypothetical protein